MMEMEPEIMTKLYKSSGGHWLYADLKLILGDFGDIFFIIARVYGCSWTKDDKSTPQICSPVHLFQTDLATWLLTWIFFHGESQHLKSLSLNPGKPPSPSLQLHTLQTTKTNKHI